MTQFKSLKDHVYQYISERISDGTMKPHEKISEKAIMEDLDISRTPVREALIQLASDGYLENIPRKGFVVSQITAEKASEVYELIGLLDGYSAEMAYSCLTQDDYDQMSNLVELMKKDIIDENIKQYYNHQIDFHNVYINKCGNEALIETINHLRKRFIRQSYDAHQYPEFKSVLEATNKEHSEILLLFKTGSPKAINDYIKRVHWDNAYVAYDALL